MTEKPETKSEYARRRRQQELDAAKAAETVAAREAHEQIAEIFNDSDLGRPTYMNDNDAGCTGTSDN